MEQEGEDRRHTAWHLDRSISIGHIITTLAIAGSIFVWAMSMDTRVTIIETRTQYAAEATNKIESNYREGMGEIKSSLIRIENKIDTKADKK